MKTVEQAWGRRPEEVLPVKENSLCTFSVASAIVRKTFRGAGRRRRRPCRPCRPCRPWFQKTPTCRKHPQPALPAAPSEGAGLRPKADARRPSGARCTPTAARGSSLGGGRSKLRAIAPARLWLATTSPAPPRLPAPSPAPLEPRPPPAAGASLEGGGAERRRVSSAEVAQTPRSLRNPNNESHIPFEPWRQRPVFELPRCITFKK